MAKRRTFTPEFKLQVVLEALRGAKSNAEIVLVHYEMGFLQTRSS